MSQPHACDGSDAAPARSLLAPDLRATLHRSFLEDAGSHRTSTTPVPDPGVAEAIVERWRWLAFPGFFGPRAPDRATMIASLDRILDEFVDLLRSEVAIALRSVPSGDSERGSPETDRLADAAVVRVLERIPAVRTLLAGDAIAGFEGDPAVTRRDEAILVHPGLSAVVVHRLAHELHLGGVPLLPRLLSEIAHRDTGIDIHPGAVIGRSLFIDHGTGVVIGETTVIGDRCRIYQGVTLGASRFETEADGSIRRGHQRHPTLEDDVTVYAGATILGGDTVVGRGSVVNGGVFLTQSVPPDSVVSMPKLEVRLRSR